MAKISLYCPHLRHGYSCIGVLKTRKARASSYFPSERSEILQRIPSEPFGQDVHYDAGFAATLGGRNRASRGKPSSEPT